MSTPTAHPPESGSPRPRSSTGPSRGDRRTRRRAAVAVLGAIALLAAVVGLFVGADPEPAPQRENARAPASPREQEVQKLPLRQRVGQTLMISFRGAEAPDYVLDLLRKRQVAGVVLFRDNVVARGQVRELTRSLQRAARGRALIAADQEGGAIRQLPWAAPLEGQASQADARAAAQAARDGAVDMKAAGVNVNLAPIADVGDPGGSAIGGRSYPGDARAVSAAVKGAVRAHMREGVAPTPKHFPGFGSAQANTDDEPVTIDSSRRELERRDLPPFRAAISAGAPIVMASHAEYPALDKRQIASQSRRILRDLLRERLGFRGVVVTDSLEAEAVISRTSVEEAGERAMFAGSDLILMTGPGSLEPVREQILARARRSRSFRQRVEEAAGRVLALSDGVKRGTLSSGSARR